LLTKLEPRVVPAGEGPAFWFINTLTTVKATTDSTGGAFSMVYQYAPPGFATPYHLHHAEDEAFYVLDGEVSFFSDGQRTDLGPGGYLFLPRRLPHGLRVKGASPATMLVFSMPGNQFVSFMQEMAVPAGERRLPEPSAPDMEKMVRLCAKYEIDVLGPLPE
jgi:quercetin dioxygenase-like cupin family protein